MSAGKIGSLMVSRPQNKVPVAPTVNLHVRWAVVQPMKERHPFDMRYPRQEVSMRLRGPDSHPMG